MPCECAAIHFEPVGIPRTRKIFWTLTSFSISHSRLYMQSSFRLRQRRAAIRFLFRLRMSCTTSSCSRVKHCCFSICWKSFLLRDTIWSTESGSAIWRETINMSRKSRKQICYIWNTVNIQWAKDLRVNASFKVFARDSCGLLTSQGVWQVIIRCAKLLWLQTAQKALNSAKYNQH